MLCSVSPMMLAIIEAARMGNSPVAVSPESMTKSAPSKTAFATSLASARVGFSLTIMDSSICVATMVTFFPPLICALHPLFLQHGYPLRRYFNAKVTSGDHNAVGLIQNAFKLLQHFWFFQFGNDDGPHTRGHQLPPQQTNVPSRPNEGERNGVNAKLDAEPQIDQVLFG